MSTLRFSKYSGNLVFDNSNENWDYLSKCLVEHEIDNEEQLRLAKERFKESVEKEKHIRTLLSTATKDEHFFYKVSLMLNEGKDEKDAERQASIICYKHHPPKTYHGLIHRSIKHDVHILNSRKASFLFEEIDDSSVNWKGIVYVRLYYLQEFTSFCLHYTYDVVDKKVPAKDRRPEILVVEMKEMMKKLKRRRLLNKFMKIHPAAYAGYLMDK